MILDCPTVIVQQTGLGNGEIIEPGSNANSLGAKGSTDRSWKTKMDCNHAVRFPIAKDSQTIVRELSVALSEFVGGDYSVIVLVKLTEFSQFFIRPVRFEFVHLNLSIQIRVIRIERKPGR